MVREIDLHLLTQVKNAYSRYLIAREKNNFRTLRTSNLVKYKEMITLIKGLISEIEILLKNRELLEDKILTLNDETKKRYFITLLNGLIGFKEELTKGKKLLESPA